MQNQTQSENRFIRLKKSLFWIKWGELNIEIIADASGTVYGKSATVSLFLSNAYETGIISDNYWYAQKISFKKHFNFNYITFKMHNNFSLQKT